MFYSSYYNSPVGKLLLASDGTNLTGLWIEKQKYYACPGGDHLGYAAVSHHLSQRNFT